MQRDADQSTDGRNDPGGGIHSVRGGWFDRLRPESLRPTRIGAAAGILGLGIGVLTLIVFGDLAGGWAWALGTVGSAWYLRREESVREVVGSACYLTALHVLAAPITRVLPQIDLTIGSAVLMIMIVGITAIGAAVVAGLGYLLHR